MTRIKTYIKVGRTVEMAVIELTERDRKPLTYSTRKKMLNYLGTWKIIFIFSACIYTSSGAPVTCDPVSAQQCLDEFLRDLERIAFSHLPTNVTASEICNASYPNYLQCIQPKISSCNPPIDFQNIWVKAAEYLCSANETAQIEGLTCLAVPQVAQGIQSCNVNIPKHTSDFCRIRNDYIACVSGITASYCAPVGYFVVRDYLLYSFKSTSDVYKCEEVMSTTTTSTTTTLSPTPNVFSTVASEIGSPDICGRECLESFSPLFVYEALVNRNYTLTLYTDACSNLSRYEQCMQKHKDCNPDTILQHFLYRDPFSYACGSGYQGIISHGSCWEKNEVKQTWTSCVLGVSGSTDICNSMSTRASCLKIGITQHCDSVAADVVSDFLNASSYRLLNSVNCTFPTTPISEPEVTEPEPEPEEEVTENSATTEPGPEVVETTVTSEPEPEMTEKPVPVSTGSTPVCDLNTYSQCAVDLSQAVHAWMLNVTSQVSITHNFNFSHIDSLCSIFLNQYKPCASAVVSGCPKDVTLIHDTLTTAVEYVCTTNRSAILTTLPCLVQPTVIQGLQSCRNSVPQVSTDICQVSDHYVKCLNDVTSGVCTEAARVTLSDFVSISLKPVGDLYSCDDTTKQSTSTVKPPPTTTTTTTTPFWNVTNTVVDVPFRCYDCHSGGGSWQNPHCTQDGSIADWAVAVTSCEDRCFAKTNKWNKDVIYRGCAGKYLPVDHPRSLPRSGCHKIKGEVWCFCEGDKCNVMSMEDYLP